MHSTTRLLLIALLSLLLPLQGSLAYARSVAMMTGNANAQALPANANSAEDAQVADYPAEHPLDHQAVHQTDHSLAAPPTGFASHAHQHAVAVHHVAHKKIGNACYSCAKCCLTGAAAPPVLWSAAADLTAARVVFFPSSAPLSCFIPDGPERPPRHFQI